MGKKKDDTKPADRRDAERCGSCKNFDAKKKGGYCRRRDKKRSADDKVCGHFDPH